MKNKLLFSGLGLAYLLNLTPVVSQNRINIDYNDDRTVKIKIPKDASHELRHTVDSLIKLIDQKYKALAAPVNYEKDILTARRNFSLDSLKADEKRATALLADSAKEEREIVRTRFKIQKENIRLQYASQLDNIQNQLEVLKDQKQEEINAIILQYFPYSTPDTLNHKPGRPHPPKDSLDLKSKNSTVTPNPSNGDGNIIVDKFRKEESLTLNILDGQGSVVSTSSNNTGTFSFSGLKQGLYYYLITGENGKKISEGRILVQ